MNHNTLKIVLAVILFICVFDMPYGYCQIVQINFPNDGYLDDDHITYTDIEDDGTAYVYVEDGKTYEIQIDN